MTDGKSLYSARVLCACGIKTSATDVPEACKKNALVISKGLARKLLEAFLTDQELIEHIANKMIESKINSIRYRKNKGIIVKAVRMAIEYYGTKIVLGILEYINSKLCWNPSYGICVTCSRCSSETCIEAFAALLLYMLASGLSELIRECDTERCPKEVTNFMDAVVKQYARKRYRETITGSRKELTKDEYVVYQMSPTLKSLLSKKGLLVLINECEKELSDKLLLLDEKEKVQAIMMCVAEKVVSPRKVKNPYLRIELMATKRGVRERAAREVELALKFLLDSQLNAVYKEVIVEVARLSGRARDGVRIVDKGECRLGTRR